MRYLGFHCNKHLSDVQTYASYSLRVRNVSGVLGTLALIVSQVAIPRLFPVAVGLGIGSVLGHISYRFFSHVESKLNEIIQSLEKMVPDKPGNSLFL